MKNFEVKSIIGEVADVDRKTRKVKIVLNRTGVKDLDNDIIDKSAFEKTIQERGPKGTKQIWHLTDHTPSLKSALGKFDEVYMDGHDLVGINEIVESKDTEHIWKLYLKGDITEHSIGFKTIKADNKEDASIGKYNLIKEVMLYEGSAVLWGANMHTPTLSVGKSLTKEEAVSEYAKTLEELNKLHKLFKTGHLSDESFELLEMKVAQLTDKLQHLFTQATQPDAKSVEPDQMKDVFETFIQNTLNTADDGSKRTSIPPPAA
jgi:HK97 family phage prohead protease